MYPPSRVHRIAKWTGVVVCCLFAVLTMWSHFWVVSWRYDRTTIGSFMNGTLTVARHAPRSLMYGPGDQFPIFQDQVPWWSVDRHSEPYFRWRPWWWRSGPRFSLMVPAWTTFLLLGLPTAYLFYLDRRSPRGHCQSCGYNLTGNESGACPECGNRIVGDC